MTNIKIITDITRIGFFQGWNYYQGPKILLRFVWYKFLSICVKQIMLTEGAWWT